MMRGAAKSPAGVKPFQGDDFQKPREISTIPMPGGDGVVTGRPHHNTFKVKPSHEKLAGSKPGVRFNVETLPAAQKQDRSKEKINFESYIETMKKEATAFYDDSKNIFGMSDATFRPQDVRLEAAAEHSDNLVFAGGQGFLYAALTAFAQHLPLALGPDQVWSVLTYAFAKHVDENAEALRKNFVSHDGKKRLEVKADHMVMSGGDPATLGSSPKVWEETIFPEFSKQIKGFVNERVHGVVASDFSTTTAASRAAAEITLMCAMKNYFSYGFQTLCGIPCVTLLGSEEDWVALRARAEELGQLMMPEFAGNWVPLLLPVLDEFVESYRGNVNHGFWQSMVKLRDTAGGSDSYPFISGWLQIFFPYLNGGKVNDNLKPWQDAYFSGPDPKAFPAIVSSAPVDWEYYGAVYNLHFHAGITGCMQDPTNGTLTPISGWYVTHDFPQEPDARLRVVKAEIEALLTGHADEARKCASETSNKRCEADWYRRVNVLHMEQISLEGPSAVAPLKRTIAELENNQAKLRALGRELRDIRLCSAGRRNAITTDDMIKAFFEENGGG